MAQTAADQFYRSRGQTGADLIDDDRRCIQCGYALRGLRFGAACPECGRRILRASGTGLNGAPPDVLASLQLALTLILPAWAAGMAVWMWCYYGLLMKQGLILAACMLVPAAAAVLLFTGAWNRFEEPPLQMHRSLTAMLRLVMALSAFGLILVALVLNPWKPSSSPTLILPVVSITAFAWVGMQALSCLLLARVADAGGDSRLADRFRNLSWALGLCIAFISPYVAILQTIQYRSGAVPLCCMGGYLVVVGFAFAQVFYAISMLRVLSLVRWAISYRRRFEGKTAEMIERIEAARQGGGESTALVRD